MDWAESAISSNTTTTSAVPGCYAEDIRMSNIYINYAGGGNKADNEKVPAYGFYFRRVKGIEMNHIKLDYTLPEGRNAFSPEDVHNAYFDQMNIKKGTETALFFDLRNVSDFSIDNSRYIKNTKLEKTSVREKL